MRTLKGQNNVAHDQNYSLFPEGAIINETENQEGTPVVREVYNDLLMNIYSFVKSRGINFNQLEDNEQNGYQFINALKRNINELNDSEKLLNLNGSTWNIDLNFDLIPNKYFVFARATENSNVNYSSIKGSTNTSYSFESNDFKTGDEILLIIDQNKVRAYNLNFSSSVNNLALNIFGTPLRYSSSGIWYYDNGILYNDKPESFKIEQILKSQTLNENITILEIFQKDSHFICCCFDNQTFEISFYKFDYSNMQSAFELTIEGININQDLTENRDCYFYYNGEKLMISNQSNNSSLNNYLHSYSVDFLQNKLIYSNEIVLEETFQKAMNSISAAGGIISFIDGSLYYYQINRQVQLIGEFPSFIGMIFEINNKIYYYDGSNAIQWNLNF